MVKRLKEIIFAVLTIIITIAIFAKTEPGLEQSIVIFLFMVVAIMLAIICLGEEPGEFFDNFGNYKKAKISAILMVIATIYGIKAGIELMKMLMII